MSTTKKNEYTTYAYQLENVNKFPLRGSVGMYIHNIAKEVQEGKVSMTALKLFLMIVSDVNEYNQTVRTRREFSDAMGLKYNRGRMSVLVNELVSSEWLAIFDGNIITVNPFLVVPQVKEPKMKAALQESWRDIIEYKG